MVVRLVFHAAQCDVLLEEVFAPCHAYVSPSLYHQQCRYQACRCGSRCLCTALSHYAYICTKHHVMINFRAHVSECGALPILLSIHPSIHTTTQHLGLNPGMLFEFNAESFIIRKL